MLQCSHQFHLRTTMIFETMHLQLSAAHRPRCSVFFLCNPFQTGSTWVWSLVNSIMHRATSLTHRFTAVSLRPCKSLLNFTLLKVYRPLPSTILSMLA